MSDIEHDTFGHEPPRRRVGPSPTPLDLIGDERRRQVTEEGYTAEHDDQYTEDQLALAAAAYAMPPDANGPRYQMWPWHMSAFKPTGDDVEGRIRELAKAGALICAEIERLLRWAES